MLYRTRYRALAAVQIFRHHYTLVRAVQYWLRRTARDTRIMPTCNSPVLVATHQFMHPQTCLMDQIHIARHHTPGTPHGTMYATSGPRDVQRLSLRLESTLPYPGLPRQPKARSYVYSPLTYKLY